MSNDIEKAEGLEELRKERIRASKRKYNKSPKGRAAQERWEQSERGQAYQKSEARKIQYRKYFYKPETQKKVKARRQLPKTKIQIRVWKASEKGREYRRKYDHSPLGKAARQRMFDKNPGLRVANCLRARFRAALKGGCKTGSAVRDLGCTIPEFKLYIEALWEPGMTWANWGKGPGTWQIDHRRPLASFDLTQREQVKEACLFINLQPLWYEDHLKKSANDCRHLR